LLFRALEEFGNIKYAPSMMMIGKDGSRILEDKNEDQE
jgi:hypothetical protein